MRTENIAIHSFEYRGYKCAVVEGVGYVKGDPYCLYYSKDIWFEEKGNYSSSFNASPENPCELNEAIKKLKSDVDHWIEIINRPPEYSGKVCRCGYKFKIIDMASVLSSGEEICQECSFKITMERADKIKQETGRQVCITCLQEGRVHYLDGNV